MNKTEFKINELVEFLLEAKVNSYAGGGAELKPQRPGFKELEFSKGDWEYRDSYCGFFFAPGQEIVRYKGKPVWAMAYSGGMLSEYHGNKDFAKQTFTFLKKCLALVELSRPFRGPTNFKDGDFEYKDANNGDISDFSGTEHIYYKGKEVFRQHYIGGYIIPK